MNYVEPSQRVSTLVTSVIVGTSAIRISMTVLGLSTESMARNVHTPIKTPSAEHPTQSGTNSIDGST
jgi:hypothetical protein